MSTTPKHPFSIREYNFVHGVVMRYLRDEQAAADVTQEALLRAFTHVDGLDENIRFFPWLYRIAATTSLMHLRQKRRERISVPAETVDSVLRDELDPQSVSEYLDIVRHLEAILSPISREVFNLRFLEGYQIREIASKLGITVCAAKGRVSQARRQLLQGLAQLIPIRRGR